MKVRGSYDVVVYGGGPAGTCASLASRRHAVSTLLIDHMPMIGRNLTNGYRYPSRPFGCDQQVENDSLGKVGD